MFLGMLEANNQQLQFCASHRDISVHYYPITQGLTVFAKKKTTQAKQTNPTITVLNEKEKKKKKLLQWKND